MERSALNSPSHKKRVLLDTNLFISYLLNARENPASSIDQLIGLTISGAYDLIAPDAVLTELRRTVDRKPYLNRSINQEDLELLLRILGSLRLSAPPIPGPYPPVVRDKGDDYLLAYAKAYDVDFLVTGDRELLVLRELLDRP